MAIVVKSNILIVSEEFNYLHKHEQHVFIKYNPIRNKITSDTNHDHGFFPIEVGHSFKL